MKRTIFSTRMSLLPCLLISLVGVLLLRTGIAQATSPLKCGQWNIVPSPNAGSYANRLNGVTVLSPTNVWAVGSYSNSSSISYLLIEHWDGTQWTATTFPKISGSLQAVAAVSATDVWAVGNTFSGGSPAYETLTAFYC